MPFAKPTLKTLLDRAIADINARLPNADARLAFSNLNVLANVQSGGVSGLYGFLDWISNQVIPDTAEVEFLQRWASVWGINRKAATPATGNVTFSGTSGLIIPTGALLVRSDGIQYLTTADVTLSNGTGAGPVVAATNGASTSALAATALNLVSPVVGVNSAVTVAAGGLTGGADVEADDSLRARLIERIQNPPHGGDAQDYVNWALEVSGVTRAWVYPAEAGLGTVTVRFVRDNDGTGAAIIPDAGEVATVQAYLDARRPVTAIGLATPPTYTALNFSIQGLNPSTVAVKAAVEAELRDLIFRESIPGGTILLSHIRAAISAATGETDYALISPYVNVTHAPGEMSIMGAITWS